METMYTSYRKPYKLLRLFIILVYCAAFNFISLPESMAQISQRKSGSFFSGSTGSSYLTIPCLQLNKRQAFSSPTFYSLSSQAVWFIPLLEDTTNELSDSQASTYLLDEHPDTQTLTLRLPKVDAGKIMIAVYSPAGHLLMKKSVRNQEESKMEMDLKDLQAGAYFLEIQAAEIYEKVSFMLE